MKFTSKDLMEAMGLKVGDKIKIHCVESIFYVHDISCVFGEGTYAIETLEKSYRISYLLDRDYTILPRYTLTEDEKAIVRNIDDKWKWIHRTNEEILFISTGEAQFNSTNHTWDYDGGHYFNRFPYAEKLFTFISCGKSVSLDDLRKCL